jgi:hypothetical protein
VGIKSPWMKEYLRMVVDLQKMLQSTSMIIMSMRDDGEIASSEVDVHPRGIIDEKCALPHVEKDLLPLLRLDVQTQSMFHWQLLATRIFRKNRYYHSLFFAKL